jgi:plasmid maintenance system antidote protein VapI
MDEPKRSISDLQTSDLTALGLSRSYAFELIKGTRKPSLEVAVRIEQALGIPASSWLLGARGEAAA